MTCRECQLIAFPDDKTAGHTTGCGANIIFPPNLTSTTTQIFYESSSISHPELNISLNQENVKNISYHPENIFMWRQKIYRGSFISKDL